MLHMTGRFGTITPMQIALSTRWNASRHTRGEDMIEEILGLGFDAVELGYDLRIDLVAGVQNMIARQAVRVTSVHNYCPVPVASPRGHPEIWTFADSDPRVRDSAVQHTSRTLRFAAEVGARVVVAHAGRVDMPQITRQLLALCEEGKQFSDVFAQTTLKLQVARDKKVARHLDYVRACIEQLIPVLDETGVRLALENLPTWESVPTELEAEALCRDYGARGLRYWHDIGHAQVRQNLGLINQERWLQRLRPHLAGMHIHDVLPPGADHLMPPAGKVDFAALKSVANSDVVKVIEPAPQTPPELVSGALAFLRGVWAPAGRKETA